MSAPMPKWVEYADASRLMARGLVLHPMQKHTLWLEALANGEIRSRRYTLRDGLVLKILELQPGFWTGKDW